MDVDLSEDNGMVIDLLLVSVCLILIFFIIYFSMESLRDIFGDNFVFDLLLIIGLSILFSLMLGKLKENLWLAKKTIYIFLISGWFVFTSLIESGLTLFLFGIYFGIIICLILAQKIFPEIIPYKLISYSEIWLETGYTEDIVVESRNKLELIGMRSKKQYYQDHILNCENRVKFLDNKENKLIVAIIAFELNQDRLIQTELSDITVSWIKEILDNKWKFQVRKMSLPHDIITEILSDYVVARLDRKHLLLILSFAMIIVPLLVCYGIEIISFLNSYQWIVSLPPLLFLIYDRFIRKKKHRRDES